MKTTRKDILPYRFHAFFHFVSHCFSVLFFILPLFSEFLLRFRFFIFSFFPIHFYIFNAFCFVMSSSNLSPSCFSFLFSFSLSFLLFFLVPLLLQVYVPFVYLLAFYSYFPSVYIFLFYVFIIFLLF